MVKSNPNPKQPIDIVKKKIRSVGNKNDKNKSSKPKKYSSKPGSTINPRDDEILMEYQLYDATLDALRFESMQYGRPMDDVIKFEIMYAEDKNGLLIDPESNISGYVRSRLMDPFTYTDIGQEKDMRVFPNMNSFYYWNMKN